MDKIHVVLEIVRDNEGNPGIWAYRSLAEAEDQVTNLNHENGEDNEDVLVVMREIAVSV